MVVINPLVAFKIFEHYPNNIGIIAIQDEENDSWNAAIYKIEKDGSLGDVLFELDHYKNKSRMGAISEINYSLKRAIETVKIMAN